MMKETIEVSKIKYIGIWILVTVWVLVGVVLTTLR